MKIGIIIPCYNEANRLNTEAFIKFINTHTNYFLCFVNDGSTDETLLVLKSIKSKSKNDISIIDVKKNSGKAAAVRSGARYLFNRQDIDYIGFIDADLSTDFDDLKSLVKKLHNNKNLSMICGSRGKGDGNIERKFFRNLFSKVIKTIVSVILRLPIHDTQCGAKVFRRNVIPIAFINPFLTKWLFDVEIFIRLKKHYGKTKVMSKIKEQALKKWIHVDDSKLGIKDAIKIPIMLLVIWVSYNITN